MLNSARSSSSAPFDRPIPEIKLFLLFVANESSRFYWLLIVLVLLLIPGGCASFKPVPIDQVPFKERAKTNESEDLIVTVAVLSNKETEQVFGLPLADQGVQSVWIKVENKSNRPIC